MTYYEFSEGQIVNQYKIVEKFHNKFLKEKGVKLPKLYDKDGKFTKNALVLTYLSKNYPRTYKVSKSDITKFIRRYYPNVNDVQQPRHLGAQDGWYIIAGGRDDITENLKKGYYRLYSLKKPYPDFKKGHRISNTDGWEQIKRKYNYRCATCGSLEDHPHLHWKATKTVLQKGHMDPNKPLVPGNIIPQCQKCNRGDRNRWVYDEKGRVVKLAKPSFVKNFDKEVRLSIYKILKEEFEK